MYGEALAFVLFPIAVSERPRNPRPPRCVGERMHGREVPRVRGVGVHGGSRAWVLTFGCCLACGSLPEGATGDVAEELPNVAGADCPREPISSERAPGTEPHHRNVETWLDALGPAADAVLLDAAAVAELNRNAGELKGGPIPLDDRRVPELANDEAIGDRMDFIAGELAAGRYVLEDPGAFERAREIVRNAAVIDHERLVVEETPLRCVPVATGIFAAPVDRDFDRNACTSLHPGRRVRVLRRSADGEWFYVHGGDTSGWLRTTGLGPRLSLADLERWSAPERLFAMRDDVQSEDGFPLRIGISVPIERRDDEGFDVWLPSHDGLRLGRVRADAGVAPGPWALTRRRLFELAFGQLGAEYGWGGRAGQRDCSAYLQDLFGQFGISLGRHSAIQATQGRSLDIEGWSESDKLAAIEREARQGVVILYMRGHVMLYVGSDRGRPYAISSISEWIEPCPGGPDTVHRIDRVEVTTLELGRGTERKAFLERLTRLAVFGGS